MKIIFKLSFESKMYGVEHNNVVYYIVTRKAKTTIVLKITTSKKQTERKFLFSKKYFLV